TDLELINLKSPARARNILAQVAGSIAVAEAKANFEHRDLHWGNVLIQTLKDNENESNWNYDIDLEHRMLVPLDGFEVCIIDYTLSRLEMDNELFFTPLDSDSYFTQTGDYQFDIYRKMKTITKQNWAGYYPRTNVLWLDYLCHKLLELIAKSKVAQNGRRRSARFISFEEKDRDTEELEL
ncbi:Serine/threonine-protein kinase haspin, partial [Nowakowskiella sp. JEL0078]